MTRATPLPVEAVLPDLCAALARNPNAVLIAPPGAGKTTAVAPALLGQAWCEGTIVMLAPRRLAARAAAERMADIAGEPVGRTIGYRTRLDSKVSAATRIEVVTEGIFTNRLQADPELAGISAVLFDEAHERSLEGDTALALALDTQGALRPDLRLLVMSATLDGAAYAGLMRGAPVIESQGRAFPLRHIYTGRSPDARIEEDMARAIRQALGAHAGDVLAFLPGVGEIERTAERLGDLPGTAIHRLHGSLNPAEQQAAIHKGDGRKGHARKVVLATAIAETSLTIDGVGIVVDSGLARRPRYDRGSGLTRLVTEKVSRAAANQRAGRAGRQGPGVAYRLWDEQQTQSLIPFDPPEILEADLSGLILDLSLWGVGEPASLNWLDPPPVAAVAEARDRLKSLGAIDEGNRPTPHGRAIARLPLPPRLAHMLVAARHHNAVATAARVAVLLGERGIGGPGADLSDRLRRWRQARDPRSSSAMKLAERWARLVDREADWPGEDGDAGLAVALGFPDRVARRRGPDGADWITVGGRGLKLDPADSLARHEWLAVAEAQGSAAGARILAAAPLDLATVERLFGDRIISERSARYDPATRAVTPERRRRLGAITLSRGADSNAEPAAIRTALVEAVRDHGLHLLPWPEEARALQARAAFARGHDPAIPDISGEALAESLAEWLPPLLEGIRRLDAVPADSLTGALRHLIGWDAMRTLDRIAPARLATPAGTSHEIDYAADGGPTVHVRVQALFGVARHPAVADGKVPLTLALTSPAGRPIQTTRDLPGFWTGSWRAVAREMRGRYPRHPWPDDPAAATATVRTKNADRRNA